MKSVLTIQNSSVTSGYYCSYTLDLPVKDGHTLETQSERGYVCMPNVWNVLKPPTSMSLSHKDRNTEGKSLQTLPQKGRNENTGTSLFTCLLYVFLNFCVVQNLNKFFIYVFHM